MTLAKATVSASAVAHRILAEEHDKAAQVLRRRNPAAALRHAEQARTLNAAADAALGSGTQPA